MSIELLLTDAGSLSPVLETLAAASAGRAPEPELRRPSSLAVPGQSDDLTAEKWGVIVPDTAAGAERLAWLQPLVELRSKQCGLSSAADVPVFKVAPGMDRRAARIWRADYEQKHPMERPGYLLIAGDLHEVSHALQQELMLSASVGRLCFTTPDGGLPWREGYEAYCTKVRDVELHREDWEQDARMLFYASHDGSEATATGYQDLVRGAYADARADREIRLAATQLFGSADDLEWGPLLNAAAAPTPAVFFSLTHGAGITDPVEQRLRQGALVLRELAGKRRTEIIDHRSFEQTFLPHGFWFLKACFGGGTPASSAYEHWLRDLHLAGRYGGAPGDALKYLAADATPFIARLPQVSLARSDGPLGIFAHVDLAWIYGVEALDEVNPAAVRGEHGPYYDVLRMVAGGHRFGAAIAGLTDKAQQLGSHLALLYGEDAVNRDAVNRDAANGDADGSERLLRRAWLWMRYLDLAGYILLGDPAAQLPVRAARDAARSASSITEIAAPELSAERKEQAVLAYLRQSDPPTQIAREAGVHLATLERWLHIYREAGRRALAEKG